MQFFFNFVPTAWKLHNPYCHNGLIFSVELVRYWKSIKFNLLHNLRFEKVYMHEANFIEKSIWMHNWIPQKYPIERLQFFATFSLLRFYRVCFNVKVNKTFHCGPCAAFAGAHRLLCWFFAFVGLSFSIHKVAFRSPSYLPHLDHIFNNNSCFLQRIQSFF